MLKARYIPRQIVPFCKRDEQRRQFILDSRAMRQQIKTGISGESELSQGAARHMTDRNVMQTLPQLSLSLVPGRRLVAFQTCDSRKGREIRLGGWELYIKKINLADSKLYSITKQLRIHMCCCSEPPPHTCVLERQSVMCLCSKQNQPDALALLVRLQLGI